MIKLTNSSVILKDGVPHKGLMPSQVVDTATAGQKTMAGKIMRSHNVSGNVDNLRIKFDSLISHDITYVGIIQTARASGLERFPMPYVLTNCHNSLCAVGGTINEDDHIFGLSAAHKYGGIYVPANVAVIHQYAREMMAGCGRMILGSDSHTRYGALGAMGFGEGGPELVKQLLTRTYDIKAPDVILVYLSGEAQKGVGPHDVALALCAAVYDKGFVKNKVLEFVGPGIKNLSMDFRIAIDVMTTETACLSSIWQTDGKVEQYYTANGRANDYSPLLPEDGACYEGMIEIDLSSIEPMVALPFHPSKAFTIRELKENAGDILREIEQGFENSSDGRVMLRLCDKLKDGKIFVDQGIIAGCAGGMYDNIAEAAAILDGHSVGNGYFSLSIYPSSLPVNLELIKNGVQKKLMDSGALFKPCFCGPCFGAGDVPGNNTLSIRHTTRNFSNREGSRTSDGQIAGVMLMDSRSIAATARFGGELSSAADVDYNAPPKIEREFDGGIYKKRCYSGFGNPKPDTQLRLGPGITDWPKVPALSENALFRLASVIHDPVTTTDELIPSGETSSYRSNPLKLAEYTLSRRDPAYVEKAKETAAVEAERSSRKYSDTLKELIKKLGLPEAVLDNTSVSSAIFAEKPGDGSAREQAASCQRVLGGGANICREYATKRYRSNCINWGILPFTISEATPFDYSVGDWIFVPGIRKAVENAVENIPAVVLTEQGSFDISLLLSELTEDERQIILSGCLINYYSEQRQRVKTKNKN